MVYIAGAATYLVNIPLACHQSAAPAVLTPPLQVGYLYNLGWHPIPKSPCAAQTILPNPLHGIDGILDDLYPAVAFFLGAGVNLHHLWVFPSHANQEQAFLLMGHLSDNQLFQRDHS